VSLSISPVVNHNKGNRNLLGVLYIEFCGRTINWRGRRRLAVCPWRTADETNYGRSNCSLIKWSWLGVRRFFDRGDDWDWWSSLVLQCSRVAHRERDRQTETQTQRETEIDRQKQTERDRERKRETETAREKRERDRHRQTQTERERQTDKYTDKQTDIREQTDRASNRERKIKSQRSARSLWLAWSWGHKVALWGRTVISPCLVGQFFNFQCRLYDLMTCRQVFKHNYYIWFSASVTDKRSAFSKSTWWHYISHY